MAVLSGANGKILGNKAFRKQVQHIAVGHTGEKITYAALRSFRVGNGDIFLRHLSGMFTVIIKQGGEYKIAATFLLGAPAIVVHMRKQKIPQLVGGCRDLRRHFHPLGFERRCG